MKIVVFTLSKSLWFTPQLTLSYSKLYTSLHGHQTQAAQTPGRVRVQDAAVIQKN
jgi:hypothetical protein